jgi:retron-type reverse transcriptase
MKRIGNLWDGITSIENIKLAHKKASKGKSHYSEVKEFNKDPDRYCKEIQDLLLSNKFTTSKYTIKEIFDGRKDRVVHKLPYFPDRVVQHALMNLVGDILCKSLIRDTFQSIPNRGTSDAAARVRALIKNKKPRYALKVDVKKYYPSVNSKLLMQKIESKIKCKDTLNLISDILDSSEGLPIGNLTSQIFGNFYLSELDWKIKQEFKPLGYFRYCDDLLFFANSKKFLRNLHKQVREELQSLGLVLKDTSQIYEVSTQGVDFVGFVFYPNRSRLRKSIKISFQKSCRKPLVDLSSIMAYKGWLMKCRAGKLWRKHTRKLTCKYRKQINKVI